MDFLANDRMRMIVTAKCNLDCFYCHNEGQAKDDSFIELDLISAIASSLQHAGTRASEVTVSGGEPLLHAELRELITVAATFADTVTMVSNGLLADRERLAPLASAGLKKIRIGVDSLRDTKPRPSKGYLEKPFHVIDTVNMAKELGMGVDVNVVVTKFNRSELGHLAAFAVENGLSIKFFEHVDVDEYGADGFGGNMAPRPQIPFDEFTLGLEQVLGHKLQFAESGQFGSANVACTIGETEIRYCRYLCSYNLCWLTGTRVDAHGYVYNCMVNRGIDRLTRLSSIESTLDVLSLATQRPCRYASEGGQGKLDDLGGRRIGRIWKIYRGAQLGTSPWRGIYNLAATTHATRHGYHLSQPRFFGSLSLLSGRRRFAYRDCTPG